jgi:hypothetical protein
VRKSELKIKAKAGEVSIFMTALENLAKTVENRHTLHPKKEEKHHLTLAEKRALHFFFVFRIFLTLTFFV